MYSFIFCAPQGKREREREEGRGSERERERDRERQSAERQRGRKARRDMGMKKGQRGRKEGKGRLIGITAETSLKPLSVQSPH